MPSLSISSFALRALALGALATSTSAYPKPCKQGAGRALYLTTNEPAANQIIAIPIGADGLLSGGSAIDTGGSGANAITGATGQPAAPDALFSQSALTVVGQVSNGDDDTNKNTVPRYMTYMTTYLPTRREEATQLTFTHRSRTSSL